MPSFKFFILISLSLIYFKGKALLKNYFWNSYCKLVIFFNLLCVLLCERLLVIYLFWLWFGLLHAAYWLIIIAYYLNFLSWGIIFFFFTHNLLFYLPRYFVIVADPSEFEGVFTAAKAFNFALLVAAFLFSLRARTANVTLCFR